MRLARPTASAGIAIALAIAATTARAQDAALGGQLFDQGLADMKAGAYDRGCPRLAESYRVDARAGTLFTLAECEAAWGKLASATAHYEDFLRLAATMSDSAIQRERSKLARDQVAKLAPDVPRLTVTIAAPAPEGTVVRRNGVIIGAPELGTALATDPGEVVLTAQAPGGPVASETITLARGERRAVALKVLPPPPAPLAPGPVAARFDAPPPPPSTPLRPIAWTAGALGVAALGVSLVTGGLALAKKSTIDAQCHGSACSAEGKRAADSAQAMATISTATFIGGVAAIGVGGVLLVLSPSPRR